MRATSSPAPRSSPPSATADRWTELVRHASVDQLFYIDRQNPPFPFIINHHCHFHHLHLLAIKLLPPFLSTPFAFNQDPKSSSRFRSPPRMRLVFASLLFVAVAFAALTPSQQQRNATRPYWPAHSPVYERNISHLCFFFFFFFFYHLFVAPF